MPNRDGLHPVKDFRDTSHGPEPRRRVGRHPHPEPGVRRLVQQCTAALGGVTNGSCEGHPPTGDSALQLRYVGIVPADHREYETCELRLRSCADRTNSAIGASSRVIAEIYGSDPRADSPPPRAAIDVVFTPQPGLAPRDYFEHLAITYAEFCEQLRGGAEVGMPAGTGGDLTARDLVSAVRQFYDSALSWHCKEPATWGAVGGIAAKALHLHAMNFGLWHHEDAVRRAGAGDREVARGKRSIDDLNARRHAAIEDIDATLLDCFDPIHNQGATLHTETPGTIVDRLSVLTLRILHANSAEQPSARLTVLEEQFDDLFRGFEEYLTRLQAGEVGFKLYRQFKSTEQPSACVLFETNRLWPNE